MPDDGKRCAPPKVARPLARSPTRRHPIVRQLLSSDDDAHSAPVVRRPRADVIRSRR